VTGKKTGKERETGWEKRKNANCRSTPIEDGSWSARRRWEWRINLSASRRGMR